MTIHQSIAPELHQLSPRVGILAVFPEIIKLNFASSVMAFRGNRKVKLEKPIKSKITEEIIAFSDDAK